MQPDPLYNDPALAAFYDWDNPWPPEFNWFLSLIPSGASVLDLGCGTGIFSVAAARRGHRVTGADPAPAMLEIARQREGGSSVTWIEADARHLESPERFDFILMTGHAFQTLLTRDDRAAAIAAIARHLAPEGRFVFDSRNPLRREWESWTPEETREIRPHAAFGMVERWNDVSHDEDTGIVSYMTVYRLADGREHRALSQIAFPAQAEIAALFEDHGLTIERWMGDYSGGAFDAGSPEIIPLGNLCR